MRNAILITLLAAVALFQGCGSLDDYASGNVQKTAEVAIAPVEIPTLAVVFEKLDALLTDDAVISELVRRGLVPALASGVIKAEVEKGTVDLFNIDSMMAMVERMREQYPSINITREQIHAVLLAVVDTVFAQLKVELETQLGAAFTTVTVEITPVAGFQHDLTDIRGSIKGAIAGSGLALWGTKLFAPNMKLGHGTEQLDVLTSLRVLAVAFGTECQAGQPTLEWLESLSVTIGNAPFARYQLDPATQPCGFSLTLAKENDLALYLETGFELGIEVKAKFPPASSQKLTLGGQLKVHAEGYVER